MDYALDENAHPRGALGLIVLQVDETIEQDFRRLLDPKGPALFVSRVPSGEDLTQDTIRQMERDLPAAAALLPKATTLDCVGYACTSGATLIGSDAVARLVKARCNAVVVTDPLAAAKEALAALGIRRLGLVSPYTADIARPVRSAFETAGIDVADICFGEAREAHVVRITYASVREAAEALADSHAPDGLFLSCTNLRTLDLIPVLEAALDLPVISSNLALAWAMTRGLPGAISGPFRLLRAAPPHQVVMSRTKV